MFPPTCRRQSHNQTHTDNSGDRLMNPSGELTLSESRHQLENDLLQGVVQPESRREESVRGEEEKTRVSWWRHMSGWEWRVLKQKVDYIKMNRMWLMIYDRSGRIRSGRAVRKRKTRRSDDGEMSTVTGGWRRWRWMQLNVFSVQLQALKAGSLFTCRERGEEMTVMRAAGDKRQMKSSRQVKEKVEREEACLTWASPAGWSRGPECHI